MEFRRPTGMTMMGVLNIVYGVIVAAAGVAVWRQPELVAEALGVIGQPDLLRNALEAGPAALVTFGIIPMMTGLAMAIAGYGMLRMYHWGRSLSIMSAAMMIGNRLAWAIVVAMGLAGVDAAGMMEMTTLAALYPTMVLGTFLNSVQWRPVFRSAAHWQGA